MESEVFQEGELWAVERGRMVTLYIKAGRRTLDCNTTPFMILLPRTKPDWFFGFIQNNTWFTRWASDGSDKSFNVVVWVLQDGQIGWLWSEDLTTGACHRVNLEQPTEE